MDNMNKIELKTKTEIKLKAKEKEDKKTKKDEEIEELDIVDELVQEAIVHFNAHRTRKTIDDSRFFFKKQEVNFILENLENPNSVKVKIIKNDDNTIFCYELERVISIVEKRKRKPKNS